MISIHAPLAGSDVLHLVYNKDNKNFYPRSPRGERPRCLQSILIDIFDFYPRSPRGERQSRPRKDLKSKSISIHAPLAGSDHQTSSFRSIL